MGPELCNSPYDSEQFYLGRRIVDLLCERSTCTSDYCLCAFLDLQRNGSESLVPGVGENSCWGIVLKVALQRGGDKLVIEVLKCFILVGALFENFLVFSQSAQRQSLKN